MDYTTTVSFSSVIFGIALVASAFGVVLCRKPLHSALFLTLTLVLVAIHFAILNSQFLATVQIMVYAGAIMVLVVFVIMLLGLSNSASKEPIMARLTVGSIVSVALFLVFGFIALETKFRSTSGSGIPDGFGDADVIGKSLISDYVLGFEIASFLLLSAIIGAVVLSISQRRKLPKNRGLESMHVEENNK